MFDLAFLRFGILLLSSDFLTADRRHGEGDEQTAASSRTSAPSTAWAATKSRAYFEPNTMDCVLQLAKRHNTNWENTFRIASADSHHKGLSPHPNGCSRCYGCHSKRYIRTDDWAFDLPGMTFCPECRTRPIARSDCDEGGYDGFFAEVGWNPAASRLSSS